MRIKTGFAIATLMAISVHSGSALAGVLCSPGPGQFGSSAAASGLLPTIPAALAAPIANPACNPATGVTGSVGVFSCVAASTKAGPDRSSANCWGATLGSVSGDPNQLGSLVTPGTTASSASVNVSGTQQSTLAYQFTVNWSVADNQSAARAAIYLYPGTQADIQNYVGDVDGGVPGYLDNSGLPNWGSAMKVYDMTHVGPFSNTEMVNVTLPNSGFVPIAVAQTDSGGPVSVVPALGAGESAALGALLLIVGSAFAAHTRRRGTSAPV